MKEVNVICARNPMQLRIFLLADDQMRAGHTVIVTYSKNPAAEVLDNIKEDIKNSNHSVKNYTIIVMKDKSLAQELADRGFKLKLYLGDKAEWLEFDRETRDEPEYIIEHKTICTCCGSVYAHTEKKVLPGHWKMVQLQAAVYGPQLEKANGADSGQTYVKKGRRQTLITTEGKCRQC